MSLAFLEVYSLSFYEIKYILRICIDEATNRKVSLWIQVFQSAFFQKCYTNTRVRFMNEVYL